MTFVKYNQTRVSTMAAIGTFVVLMAVSLHAQVTTQDFTKAIKIEKLQHPYLYFTNEEKPAILQRIKNDPEAKAIMSGLLAEGHRLLYVPVKEPPARLKHPRYAASGDVANAYGGELKDAAVKLAFLYQMTGEVRYAKKAIEFAVAVCSLDDWVQQAHTFDIIYPRVWPYNVPDDRVVFSYDITTSDRAIAMATVYDWVYPVLSKWERDKMRNGLLEKAVTRVRGNYDFFWWSSAYRCNWSPICFSGLGISSFALLTEHPQLVDVIAEAYNRIGLTFDQIGDNGGWQEGRGYYGYMMRVSAEFMHVVKRLSGGTYDLFKHKKIASHPFDFPLFTLSANFEDGSGGPVGPTAIINKLTEETNNATGAWYRQKFFDEGTTIFDILWPRPTVAPVEPEQKSKLFKSINWAVLRSDFSDPSSFTIACKAGYNDDPHHGHLDCGQFILTWNDVPFIRDLGGMRYDEIYFNEDRWLYPYASSEGHNLITVNGEQQLPAKLKDKPWKEGIGGDILKFETNAKRDYVLMDPTKAYPGKELKKWRRNIVLEKPTTALILDEVDAAPGSKIEARFFPAVASTQARAGGRQERDQLPIGVDYKILNDHALLSARGATLALIPLVLDNNASMGEDKVAAVPVTEDGRLTWIPYLRTYTTAKAKTSLIATLLVSVADASDAEKVVRSAKIVSVGSGQVEVSVEKSGSIMKWVFQQGNGGFELKD